MASLLTDFMRTNRAWKWMDECTEAFNNIKYILTHALVLWMPKFRKPFEVVADALKFAIVGVLMQEGQPIVFDSRKFNNMELNYKMSEQKMLALVRAKQMWHHYLEGSKFTLVTNHYPNTFLKMQPIVNWQQARWSAILQPYDFKWEYRPNRTNMGYPLSPNPVGHVVTMRERGCTSALYAIRRSHDD